MKGTVNYIGFTLLAALLALSSCRDLTLPPVFYTLSKEQPLSEDRGFPDTSSVFKMVRISVGADSYSLAAAGKLYIRGTGATDTWTVVDPPTGLANAMCNTLEVFGGQIYAGFYNSSDGTGYGLYTAPLSVPITTWTVTTDTNAQNVEITLLKTVGGDLFVGTNANTGNLNTLYYGNGGSSTAVTWATAPAADLSFIDVAQDSSGSNYYWVIVGPYLYRSTAVLPGAFDRYDSAVMNPPGDSDAPAYPLSPLDSPASGGLFNNSLNHTLYVGGGKGYLFSTDDGGTTWAKSAQMLDDNKHEVHFTPSFVLPASDDTSPANTIYVGTQGQGYRRIPGGDVTGSAGTLTREPTSYSITALYNGAINFLFYDDNTGADSHRLFVCTNRSGLWRGDFASGSTWTWKQE
jgi:hypothetical protein